MRILSPVNAFSFLPLNTKKNLFHNFWPSHNEPLLLSTYSRNLKRS